MDESVPSGRWRRSPTSDARIGTRFLITRWRNLRRPRYGRPNAPLRMGSTARTDDDAASKSPHLESACRLPDAAADG